MNENWSHISRSFDETRATGARTPVMVCFFFTLIDDMYIWRHGIKP